ncbi:GtrA family protein [Butyrivibrio sp. LC3010]|uniref:GtrA family protein n=1 Tax=Butyrivibrio sp. LC3010 TaxID=1280680 RepID=UPI0018C8EA0C|nr:GtrA family protein [Butyrivibrio sp. LC3010]
MRYSIAGMSGTAVEWGLFFLLNQLLKIYYPIAAIIALLFSTLVNWCVGRMILFKASGNNKREILLVYLACFSGLFLNLIIMWLLINKFSIGEMLAKMMASVIVFGWNYLFRTRIIYRHHP